MLPLWTKLLAPAFFDHKSMLSLISACDPVAQWMRHWSSGPKIARSSPARVNFHVITKSSTGSTCIRYTLHDRQLRARRFSVLESSRVQRVQPTFGAVQLSDQEGGRQLGSAGHDGFGTRLFLEVSPHFCCCWLVGYPPETAQECNWMHIK